MADPPIRPDDFPFDPMRPDKIDPILPNNDNEMDFYTQGASLPDIIKRLDPDKMAKRINPSVVDELRMLGERLVREVYHNTPQGTGALARSTKYRILPVRDSIGQQPYYQLDIIQDASARRRRETLENRHFYWYTVHHGMQPAGRLNRARPPSDKDSALYPWVERVVPTLDPEYTTNAIAWKKYKFGLQPNPYPEDSFRNKKRDIEETQSKIGQTIQFDLTDLPDVQMHYGRGRTRY